MARTKFELKTALAKLKWKNDKYPCFQFTNNFSILPTFASLKSTLYAIGHSANIFLVKLFYNQDSLADSLPLYSYRN